MFIGYGVAKYIELIIRQKELNILVILGVEIHIGGLIIVLNVKRYNAVFNNYNELPVNH